MARCPDCNKFVSYDDSLEPESDSEDVTTSHDKVDVGELTERTAHSAQVTGSVRIALACGDCGTELREASFDVDLDIGDAYAEHIEKHAEEEAKRDGNPSDREEEPHELEVEFEDLELVSRSEGKGRGLKTFYGFSGNATVSCSCGWSHSESIGDDIQASSMDECC